MGYFERRLQAIIEGFNRAEIQDFVYRAIAQGDETYTKVTQLARALHLPAQPIELAIQDLYEQGKINYSEAGGYAVVAGTPTPIPSQSPQRLKERAKIPQEVGWLNPAALIEGGQCRCAATWSFFWLAGELYLAPRPGMLHERLIAFVSKQQPEVGAELREVYKTDPAEHARFGAQVGRLAYNVELEDFDPDLGDLAVSLIIPQLVSFYSLSELGPVLAEFVSLGYIKPDAVAVVEGKAYRAAHFLKGRQAVQQDPRTRQLNKEIQKLSVFLHLGRDEFGRPIDKRLVRQQIEQLRSELSGRTYQAEPLPVSPKEVRRRQLQQQGIYNDLWRGTSESKQR